MDDTQFIANLDDPEVKKQIESAYSHSERHINVFSESDLEKIWMQCWNNPRPRFNGDKGIIYVHSDLSVLRELVNLDFLPGHEESPVIGGNYFISSYCYSVHTDSIKKSDWKSGGNWLPWKNVLIPLWHNNNPGTFITYKNRYADWAKADSKYSSYETTAFDNLEIENQWKWEPGNAYVFDAMQAHSSTKPKDNPFTLKGGVFLKFMRKYNV